MHDFASDFIASASDFMRFRRRNIWRQIPIIIYETSLSHCHHITCFVFNIKSVSQACFRCRFFVSPAKRNTTYLVNGTICVLCFVRFCFCVVCLYVCCFSFGQKRLPTTNCKRAQFFVLFCVYRRRNPLRHSPQYVVCILRTATSQSWSYFSLFLFPSIT